MCMVKSSFANVTGQNSATLLKIGTNAFLVFNREYLLECATHWSSKGQFLGKFREKVRREWSLKKNDRLKWRRITVNDIRRGNINRMVIIMMMIMITEIKIKIAKMILANVNSVLLYNDTYNNTVKTWQYFKMIRSRRKKCFWWKKYKHLNWPVPCILKMCTYHRGSCLEVPCKQCSENFYKIPWKTSAIKLIFK